jgi:hypothetical protein
MCRKVGRKVGRIFVDHVFLFFFIFFLFPFTCLCHLYTNYITQIKTQKIYKLPVYSLDQSKITNSVTLQNINSNQSKLLLIRMVLLPISRKTLFLHTPPRANRAYFLLLFGGKDGPGHADSDHFLKSHFPCF